MEQIFISYRRKDSQDAAGRIHDHLDLSFGQSVAFRDIDNIKGGINFRERVDSALRNCRVVLAIIGPQWLNIKNRKGRRLDDPNDLVRLELGTALELKVPVIPVLVSFASMPSKDRLPLDLAGLTVINCVSVPPDHSFAAGMRELIERISALTELPCDNYLELVRQSQKIGLTAIKDNFADDRTDLLELSQTRELIVVMNDGRSWVRANAEILRTRANDPGKRTRVVLLHPSSNFIDVLIRKNAKTRSQQIQDIASSFQALQINPPRPGLLEVRGHRGFNPSRSFSLIVMLSSPLTYSMSGARCR